MSGERSSGRERPQGPVGARRGLLELLPMVLIGGGIVMIVALHALRPDVHPTLHYISEYGNRSWSWLLAIALVLVAIGLIALGELLRTAIGSKLSPRMMQAAGLMLMIAAVFATDRQGGEVAVGTLAGQVHGLMSIGAFCLLVLAMASLPRPGEAGRRGERRSAMEWALPLAVVGTAVAAVAFLVVPEADGLRQRAFLAIVFGWLIAVSIELRRLPLSGDEIEPPHPGRERPSG